MTTVEWLYIELWKQNDYSLPSNLLEQAKEMEKEQQGYSEQEVKYIISEALQSALVTVDLEQWFKQFHKKTNK